MVSSERGGIQTSDIPSGNSRPSAVALRNGLHSMGELDIMVASLIRPNCTDTAQQAGPQTRKGAAASQWNWEDVIDIERVFTATIRFPTTRRYQTFQTSAELQQKALAAGRQKSGPFQTRNTDIARFYGYCWSSLHDAVVEQVIGDLVRDDAYSYPGRAC